MKLLKLAAAAAIATTLAAPAAFADKLDDVINNGVLRCAVVLDFPPIGYRDANNEPAGFDVEYCNDMAAALDVDAEVIPVTWAERLPAIVTNRADVSFSAAHLTLLSVQKQLASQFHTQSTSRRQLWAKTAASLHLKT